MSFDTTTSPSRPLDHGSIAGLFEEAVAGDRRATGRLLSIIERDGTGNDELSTLVHSRTGRAHVVGITGAPGAGKSTLVGALLGEAIADGRRPAVLAIDPSSPLTGGAILGDRIRMDDPGNTVAFIRSMASRGHSGGLALSAPEAVHLLDAVGYDPVIIETVGVGQIEVAIAATADTTVVVVTPGWGDAIQANKAGLLEVADLFVINKAERPGTADARRDLELMLDLSHVSGLTEPDAHRPEILATTATDHAGIDALWTAIKAHYAFLETSGLLRERREHRIRTELRLRLQVLAAATIERTLDTPDAQAVLQAASSGNTSVAQAAASIYRTIARD